METIETEIIGGSEKSEDNLLCEGLSLSSRILLFDLVTNIKSELLSTAPGGLLMLRRQLSSPLDKNISAKNIYSPLKIFAGLFPTFFLHMERGDGKKVFLLASRRRVKSSTCSVNIKYVVKHKSAKLL